MTTKKYYADDMQEALKQIKYELGSDAIILSSRTIKKRKGFLGMFSKKTVEVVASYDETASRKQKPVYAPPIMEQVASQQSQRFNSQPQTYSQQQYAQSMPQGGGFGMQSQGSLSSQNSPKEPFVPLANFAQEVYSNANRDAREKLEQRLNKHLDSAIKTENISELDEKITELRSMIEKLTDKVSYVGDEVAPSYSSEVTELYRLLLEKDVQRDLAQELAGKTQEIVTRLKAEPKEVMATLIRECLGKSEPLKTKKFERTVVMIIGPTGVGKTTTLVKLASMFMCQYDMKVGIINADVYRVAAQEHIKAYSDILNTPMATVYKPDDLKSALERMKDVGIVFIDTAGKVSSDKDYQNEIKELISGGIIDEILLAISASTSERVLRDIIANYAFLEKHRIVVTKVDEVDSMGVMLYIAKTSGRPLSYMTTGQSVPDDIAGIDVEDVVRSILGDVKDEV